MEYNDEQLQRLIEVIESPDVGGTHVPGPHTGTKFKLKMYDTVKDARVWREYSTTACRREGMMLIPYALPAGKVGEAMERRGGGLAQVCAFDDNVADWPRFQKAMEET